MPEITITEAAKRLAVDPSTLRHWIIRKKIPTRKLNSRIQLIHTKQLEKYEKGIGGRNRKDPAK